MKMKHRESEREGVRGGGETWRDDTVVQWLVTNLTKHL